VSTETDGATPADPGLEALVTLLQFQGIAADRGQLSRRSDARIVENGFAASSGVSKSAKVVLI
jgi:hypothetical protein